MKTPLIILVLALLTACQNPENQNILNLAGDWNFKADPKSRGISEKWYNTRSSGKGPSSRIHGRKRKR